MQFIKDTNTIILLDTKLAINQVQYMHNTLAHPILYIRVITILYDSKQIECLYLIHYASPIKISQRFKPNQHGNL